MFSIAKHRSFAFALVLLTLSPASFSLAQPWEVEMMDPSVMLADLSMLPDGLHGWALGSSGAGGLTVRALLRTQDGQHWEQLPGPADPNATFKGVCFVDENTGWIVGNGGAVYKSEDGGETWQPQVSGTGRSLTKVFFLNQYLGWITGGYNDGSSHLVLKTSNGGLTWQNLSFGNTSYSNDDIFFADSSRGWICGTDNTLNRHIHHTEDGGQTWTRQTVPAGQGWVSSICFATPQIGWASTSSLYNTPAGAILGTKDSGNTWTELGYSYLHYNYAIDCYDTQHVAVLAIQILSPAQGRVVLSTDGGDTWQQRSLPIANYSSGIKYLGSELWVASDYSQILYSPDEGLGWDWQNHAPLWNSICWSDAANGWMVAGSNQGSDGYCYRSNDGGASWQRDPTAPGGAQVYFADGDHGWMLHEGQGARIWRTTDGGDSWQDHAIGTGSWVGDFFFVDSMNGWAHGSNGTMRHSGDGGVTWAAQSLGTGSYVSCAFFVSAAEGWAGGGYGGGSGFIRHTVNGGATWIAQSPVVADHFTAAHFVDGQRGWLAAVGGRVHRTFDGGASWHIASSVPHTYLDDILMLDALNGYLVARNPHGGGPGEDGKSSIYRTEDGGSSWLLEWTGPWAKSSIGEIAAKSDGSFWACGGHNTLLRSGDLTDLFAVQVLDPILQRPAYPNPFALSTRLSASLAATGTVKLTLYDLQGRRVRSLAEEHREAGEHSWIWDGRDDAGRPLPSGVYFSRVETAGGRSETRRIVLMH